ncbi:MAG: serine hydrolase [Solirubrobacterales bacterium]
MRPAISPLPVLVAVGLLAIVLAVAVGGVSEPTVRARPVDGWRAGPVERPLDRLPRHPDVRRAREFAATRGERVSFAVVDSRGRVHGLRADVPFQSASVTKALLLAAYLDRVGEAPLDAATRARLTAMITYSDNDAADAVYAAGGDAGLEAVARRTGMRDFRPAGFWSEAWVTARDMAWFMRRLEHRALAGPHRGFAMRLLAGVVPEQRWGIPAAAGEDWSAWFKGGWRPSVGGQLVHQAALLRGGGRKLAIAVLTDAQPSHEYGTETVRGIAARLLGSGG